MEEVRSYWQVASISHFCTVFNKQFRLPIFEPEELEQAFIIDIPTQAQATSTTTATPVTATIAPKSTLTTQTESTPSSSAPVSPSNSEDTHANHNHTTDNGTDQNNGQDRQESPESPAPMEEDTSEDYIPPASQIQTINSIQQQAQQQPAPQQNDEQQDLHLLVKLAIALLKPHFNTKISNINWELYLRRIIDTNWVELEHYPSPFHIPLISQDGVELTKNLTFNELSLSDKIDIFYALCDYRFWCEDAVNTLKDFTPDELRLRSIGKDSHGYEYWYFSGTRLFRENKDLTHDIILRKKRIKELEYKLIELERDRIIRIQEEKRKAELERARMLATEAREARIAAKRQQEQETSKKRKYAVNTLPPRTGLRERRSSATSNNHDASIGRASSTRSKQQSKQQSTEQQHQSTRKSGKTSKLDRQDETLELSDRPKKDPEVECREELQSLIITPEDRAEAWRVECDSLEEWENFTSKFEKTKSTNEKYLLAYLNQELLPKIRAIYARRAAEARRKEKELIMSLTSRRVSTRIVTKRAQEEEEERQAQIREAEVRRKKIEAETRLRAELEQELEARRARPATNGNTSISSHENDELQDPQQLLPPSPSHEFDGIIHPDNLSDFYEALELVIDTVRTSKHAWPFVYPVPDTVPGYYDLITEPMDLKKLRTKVEFREYKSLLELEKDFQLLVNNCERFNGPRNVYTRMAYKLWKSFRKNVRLYLQRDLSMDETQTFVYPPVQQSADKPSIIETGLSCESEI